MPWRFSNTFFGLILSTFLHVAWVGFLPRDVVLYRSEESSALEFVAIYQAVEEKLPDTSGLKRRLKNPAKVIAGEGAESSAERMRRYQKFQSQMAAKTEKSKESSGNRFKDPALGKKIGVREAKALLLRYVEPRYPKSAMRRKRTGHVELKIVVSNGVIKSVDLIKEDRFAAFSASALEAIARWKFKKEVSDTLHLSLNYLPKRH